MQPVVLLKSDFKFLYPNLNSALNAELGNNHFLDSFLFKDQFIPYKPNEIFPFFSNAENLEVLTPPWLNFKIISNSKNTINKKSVIDYKLKIHGIQVYWKTLISDWKENEFFIDEQIKGPYSKWHHIHKFEKVNGGCLLRDEITYRVPVSIFGKLIFGHWILNDINKIFNYRQKRIEELLTNGNYKITNVI